MRAKGKTLRAEASRKSCFTAMQKSLCACLFVLGCACYAWNAAAAPSNTSALSLQFLGWCDQRLGVRVRVWFLEGVRVLGCLRAADIQCWTQSTLNNSNLRGYFFGARLCWIEKSVGVIHGSKFIFQAHARYVTIRPRAQ